MKSFNRHRVSFEISRLQKMPLLTLSKKITAKLIGIALWGLFSPITLIFHIAGYRRVDLFLDRIGHLAIEPDCLLKEQMLGLIPNQKWVLLAPAHRVANKHLLSYWESYFLVFRNPLVCFFIQSTARWGICFHSTEHYMRAIGSTQAAYRIFRDWGDRPPIIQLSDQDIRWGNQQLSAMGLPEGAWFVCLHVREGGFSPVDESLHQHRNADLERTYLAVSEIVRRGGWVIRLGDPSMTRMRAMPCTIDYAHHPLRSARLDIFLCAQSNFILGNTSGIALVGTVFGVPSALANMVPITAMGFGSRDISIPKLYKSIANNSYMGVAHIIQQGLGSAQYYSQYVEAGVAVEENSAEDILDLTKEMFESLSEKNQNDLHRSTIQPRFTGIFCDGDYAFGTPSKAGARFLLKHQISLRI
jgi:putative glycosyltransferase (TIGR04372 family)